MLEYFSSMQEEGPAQKIKIRIDRERNLSCKFRQATYQPQQHSSLSERINHGCPRCSDVSVSECALEGQRGDVALARRRRCEMGWEDDGRTGSRE